MLFKYLIIFSFFVLMVSANFLGLLFYSTASIELPISYLKYAIAILPFLLLFKKDGLYRSEKFYKDPIFVYTVFSVMLIAFSVLRSGLILSNFTQNIQVLLVLPLSYFFGRGLGAIIGKERDYLIVGMIITLAIIAAVFGIIEYSLGKYFWDAFSLYDYFFYGMGLTDPLLPGVNLPRSWISWDFMAINDGNGVARMVSFFVEPIGFGRFMGLALILFWIYRNRLARLRSFLKFCIFCLILTGVVLSYSKGAVLVFVVWLIGRRFGMKFAGLFFGALAAVVIALILQGTSISNPVVSHASSVFVGIESIKANILGFGISVNDVKIAYLFTHNLHDVLNAKSEGGFALYAIFFGIPGVMLYLYLFKGFWPYEKERDFYLFELKVLGVAILFSSIFAHSAFSLVGSGMAFMLIGYRQYWMKEVDAQ